MTLFAVYLIGVFVAASYVWRHHADDRDRIDVFATAILAVVWPVLLIFVLFVMLEPEEDS